MFAQEQFSYNPEAEKKFSAALALFKKGSYTEAAEIFDGLSHQKPLHQRTTAALVMGGKANFHLGNIQKSVSLLAELIQSYHETEYLDDAHYTLGLNYMMLRRYQEAATEFLWTTDVTRDPNLYNRALNFLDSICKEHLDVGGVEKAISISTQKENRDYLTLIVAEKYVATGDTRKAQQKLDLVLQKQKQDKFIQWAKSIQEKLSTGSNVRIAVMLPLMQTEPANAVRTLASDVLDGISFALDESKKSPLIRANIGLEVRDDGRDTSIAKNIARELAAQPDVIGVIGPLFSNIVSACASIANSSRLPMISPTANANGIASVGPYVFQANPDFDTDRKSTRLNSS